MMVTGRDIALDRWGFGQSEPWVDDYSFQADADAVLGLMDQLDIGTAHIAGCSYGSAPSIILAETHPGRIHSVTMIGGIGVQEGEGSGNYLIEHGKYAVNMLLTMVLTEILHGKDDFLVPAWVAQRHRGLKQGSRLVVLDAGHFFPLDEKDSPNLTLAGDEMRRFLAAADAVKTEHLAGVLNETNRQDLRAMWNNGPPLRGYKAWWLVMLPGLVLGFIAPRTGGVLAGLGGGLMMFDWVTGVLGVVIGAVLRRGESTRPRKAMTVIAFAIVAAIPALLTLRFF